MNNMMITPFSIPVSVIMGIYNEPLEWIRKSIDSILNQTFVDFEFIIVNDNPLRFENYDLLKKYQRIDKRIVIINNEFNMGLTESLNKALLLAKGKYIARMDADDISLSNRFEKQYDYMENNSNVIVCGTNVRYIGKVMFFYFSRIKYTNEEIKGQLFLDSCFVHSTVFIRHSVLIENNIYYDVSYKQAQDYKLWLDLLKLGDYANLRECLLEYRISSLQISNLKLKNQQSYRISIRKKMIIQYFDLMGQKIELPNVLLFNDFQKMRKLIFCNMKIGDYEIISRYLLESLYYSIEKDLYILFYSIFKGDFIYFNVF